MVHGLLRVKAIEVCFEEFPNSVLYEIRDQCTTARNASRMKMGLYGGSIQFPALQGNNNANYAPLKMSNASGWHKLPDSFLMGWQHCSLWQGHNNFEVCHPICQLSLATHTFLLFL